MGYSQKMSLMMFAVVIMGVLMAEEISAQDCASALVPCAAYLNSTKPPETCCKPLRETIMTQRKCLCDLFADKNLLPSMGINVTQVLLLPKNCGVSSDTSLCSNAPAPAPMSATFPTGATSTPLPAEAPAPKVATSPPPPVVPGGGGKNGATQMAWIGFSSLALFWAALLAY